MKQIGTLWNIIRIVKTWKNNGNLRYPPKATPPRNKALLRDYWPLVSLNKALLGPYFFFQRRHRNRPCRFVRIHRSTFRRIWRAVLRNIKIRGSDVSDVQHAELKFYNNSQTGVMVNVIQYIHTYFFKTLRDVVGKLVVFRSFFEDDSRQ